MVTFVYMTTVGISTVVKSKEKFVVIGRYWTVIRYLLDNFWIVYMIWIALLHLAED